MHHLLAANNLNVSGFAVSDWYWTNAMLEGEKVYELREIHDKENAGFIIAVEYDTQEKMVSILKENGFKNYIYGY